MAIVLDGTNGVTTNSGTLISATTIGVGGATPSTSGAGITFPATQSASTDANTLDDYEEGSWTPTIASGFSSAPTSYSTQIGVYRKIGNFVYFQFYLDANGAVANASSLQIGGLPFTSGNPNFVAHGGGFFNYNNGFNTNSGDTFHVLGSNTILAVYTTSGSARLGNAAGVNINSEFIVCGFYISV